MDEERCNILINEMERLHELMINNNPLENGRLRLENSNLIKKIQCCLDISPIVAKFITG